MRDGGKKYWYTGLCWIQEAKPEVRPAAAPQKKETAQAARNLRTRRSMAMAHMGCSMESVTHVTWKQARKCTQQLYSCTTSVADWLTTPSAAS